MEGWIKLHRQLQENPLWTCEPFTRGQAWVDLILIAAHKDSFFYIRGIKVDVSRGQVAWSEEKLSERWGWSRSKLRKFIKDLEKERQIEQHKGAAIQLITLLNYDKFQEKERQTEQQKDDRKTTEERQKDVYKNDNNVDNENNDKYKRFLIRFNELKKSKYRGCDKSKKQFNARMKDGYSLEDFEKAVKNCLRDDYHKNNPKYLTPEFITRQDKLDKYLNVKEISFDSVGLSF